jgi:formimidoylglutamate deiminase
MTVLWAQQALTADGWRNGVRVEFGSAGDITSVVPESPPDGNRVAILLPAPTNLHSHAFQRAAAGMTERRGPDPYDTFWTWRKLIYRFLDRLTPDDIEAITSYVQMEMLEAGYAAVAEFHYVHHQPGGAPYANLAELSCRVVAAAAETGIGLSLLPVFYRYGGCDRRPLGPGQVRFGCSPDQFFELVDQARSAVAQLPTDSRIGVAPHSLRAVTPEDLAFAASLLPDAPLHIHVAEQVAEVDEVRAHLGARPAEWLLANHPVDERWCLIHCTQLLPDETRRLAASGAVVGLCPITESNLGDGIFDGVNYVGAGGRVGIGSDSNVRISLTEELRTLEYSQRLRDRGRAMLATSSRSTGRVLFEATASGGAVAAGRRSGAIHPGAFADLIALDGDALDLAGKTGDEVLDSFIFAGDDRMIRDVWSAGRHLVKDGCHIRRETIVGRYRTAMAKLRARM